MRFRGFEIADSSVTTVSEDDSSHSFLGGGCEIATAERWLLKWACARVWMPMS
jgi:hypothetical protein